MAEPHAHLNGKQRIPVLVAAFCLAIGAYYVWTLARYDDLILPDYIWWMTEAMRIDDILLNRGCTTLFGLKHYPVPNSFGQLLLAVLNLLDGWRFATTTLLGLYIAAFVASALRLARAAGTGSNGMILVAFVSAGTGAIFWGGDINYQFSLSVAMFAVADLLRGKTSRPRVALVSVVAFFVHAIGFAFVAGLYGAWALYRRKFRELTALIPGALLTCWYIWGRYGAYANREGFHEGSLNPPYLSPSFLVFKINTLMKTGGFVNFFLDANSGPIYLMTREFGYAVVALGIVFSAAMAVLVFSRWAREGWSATGAVIARRADARQFALAYISASAIVALLLPPHMLGVVEFAFRVLELGIVIALLTLSFDPLRRAALVLIALFFVALNLIFMTGLGDVRQYAAAPTPQVIGSTIDRIVTLFSRAGLDPDGEPYAQVLDGDRCGPTEGRFTGLILPVQP